MAGLVLFGAVTGCGREPAPEQYREPCTTNEECGDELQCLEHTPADLEPYTMCSVTCTEDDDCPSVWTAHCGELSFCAEDGICDHSFCD